jgi:hypothetical protein
MREKLDALLKQLGDPQDLELLWNGDVLHNWQRLGNVSGKAFPGFLDAL